MWLDSISREWGQYRLLRRNSSRAHRPRAFPHLRGDDEPFETGPASQGESLLVEVQQDAAEQHQSRQVAGDIRRGWLRGLPRASGIRRAAGRSWGLHESPAAVESVIRSSTTPGKRQHDFSLGETLTQEMTRSSVKYLRNIVYVSILCKSIAFCKIKEYWITQFFLLWKSSQLCLLWRRVHPWFEMRSLLVA